MSHHSFRSAVPVSYFGSAEEAISNFDHKQGPFSMKDCCAARLGAVARAHNWGRSSKALSISTRLLYFLTIFLFFYYYYYLSYYSCSLGLLSIITFYLLLLSQYSLQQGAMCCSSTCVTGTLGITDVPIFNLFLRGGYKGKMPFIKRTVGSVLLDVGIIRLSDVTWGNKLNLFAH